MSSICGILPFRSHAGKAMNVDAEKFSGDVEYKNSNVISGSIYIRYGANGASAWIFYRDSGKDSIRFDIIAGDDRSANITLNDFRAAMRF